MLPLLSMRHVREERLGNVKNRRWSKVRFIFCSIILTSAEKHMNLFLKVALSNTIIVKFKSSLATELSLKPIKEISSIKIWPVTELQN